MFLQKIPDWYPKSTFFVSTALNKKNFDNKFSYYIKISEFE